MRKLVLLLAPFSVVAAQETTLKEIEVKAKRDTLTQQEIRESFAKDPGEALSQVEGVWKLRKGGIANDLVLRGFSGRNITVLFEGARIYGACPNRMDPPQFHVDFAQVKEIEVIKGPFDVRNYGGLGGTVNIVGFEPDKGIHGRLNLGAGSFSYLNPSLTLSYGDDRFYGLFGYSYRYSKPYKTGEGKRFTEYANYKPQNYDSTAFNVNTAWTKLGFKPSGGSKVELSYSAQRSKDVLYPYLMMDAKKDDANVINLKVDVERLRLNLYYSDVNHDMNNQKRNAMQYMETLAKTKTYGAKVEYYSEGLSAGLEAFNWNWDATTKMGMMSPQSSIPDADLTDLGLFAELRRGLGERLRFVGGIRLDTTKTKANSSKANTALYYRYHGTQSTSKTDTYPSGNLQFFYSPVGGLELFAGLGYTVRVPDVQERYFALDRMMGDVVGNPNLKPSKNTELDVGLNYNTRSLKVGFNLFYSFVKDFITVYNDATVYGAPVGMGPDSSARSYANVNARLYGGEAKATFAITQTLFIEGGASYVRGEKDTKPSENITDKDIAEIPPLKGRVALRYDRGVYFAQVEGLFQATQDRVDSDLNESKTSGWGILNLKAGGEYGRFRVVVGVDNLFDKFYYEHLSYRRDPFSSGVKVPEPGRSFYLNGSYVF